MDNNTGHPIEAVGYAGISTVCFVISLITIKDVQAFVSIIAGLVAIAAGIVSIRKSLKK